MSSKLIHNSGDYKYYREAEKRDGNTDNDLMMIAEGLARYEVAAMRKGVIIDRHPELWELQWSDFLNAVNALADKGADEVAGIVPDGWGKTLIAGKYASLKSDQNKLKSKARELETLLKLEDISHFVHIALPDLLRVAQNHLCNDADFVQKVADIEEAVKAYDQYTEEA
jgi:hypothetical protein